MLFFKSKFNFLKKIDLFERQTCRDGYRERDLRPADSLSKFCSGRIWADLKLGAGSFFQASHIEPGARESGPSFAAPRPFAGQWVEVAALAASSWLCVGWLEGELGVEFRQCSLGSGLLSRLNACSLVTEFLIIIKFEVHCSFSWQKTKPNKNPKQQIKLLPVEECLYADEMTWRLLMVSGWELVIV